MKIPKGEFAMIIGAMKSGTTSLFTYLTEHPKICGSIVKEPEYFSEHQGHALTGNYNYEDLFDFKQEKHKVLLEASTGYTKYPLEQHVPKNIYNYGLLPKFIYLVRNPFERTISYYYHVKGNDSIDKIIDKSISVSNYYLQLCHFREYFQKGQFLVVDFDEFRANTKSVIQNIHQFLGVEDYYLEEYLIENKTMQRSDSDSDLNDIMLTTKQYNKIFNALNSGMRKLQNEFEIDVSKWGF